MATTFTCLFLLFPAIIMPTSCHSDHDHPKFAFSLATSEPLSETGQRLLDLINGNGCTDRVNYCYSFLRDTDIETLLNQQRFCKALADPTTEECLTSSSSTHLEEACTQAEYNQMATVACAPGGAQNLLVCLGLVLVCLWASIGASFSRVV